MKIIILISLFIYISSIPEFYLDCKNGTSKIEQFSVDSCRDYDPDEGYCCYVEETYYDFESPDLDTADIKRLNRTKLRNLDDYERYCLGISNEGLDNLTLVAQELIKTSYADKLTIDCKIKSAMARSDGDKLTINIMILLTILIYYLL